MDIRSYTKQELALLYFHRFVTRGGKCSSDALDLSQSRPSKEAS